MNTRPNRRQFLKASALAGAATLAAPHIGRAASDKKLRIALVGLDGRGWNGLHLGQGEEVTALCDVDTTRFTVRNGRNSSFEAPSVMFPKAARYQDYRELIEEHADDFDAIVLSIPDHHHYSAAVRAIRAGKAVFCEKPLTWSPWEAQGLADEAAKHKVATQMGNQGMAGMGWRVAQAYVDAGAIGEIKEVHCWTPLANSWYATGVDRPEGEDPIPDGLDWDLWLGAAEKRPFKNGHYHPQRWRGWTDFGGGALADWGCHLMNAMFKVFDPGYPTAVECLANSGANGESLPSSKTVRWSFPAKGDRAPFEAYWHDGGRKPPRPKELEAERKLGHHGCFFVGDKGTVWIQGGHNNSAVLIPEAKRKALGKVEITAPRSIGHNAEFISAAKGETAFDAPLSHFGYAGPMTATILLGNLASRFEGKLAFDPAVRKFVDNDQANALMTRRPRSGWYPQS
jgi:predicted dehydrogenase